MHDCKSKLIRTSVELLSSELSRSRLLIQWWKTFERASDHYVVTNSNHNAPSGTDQAVKTARLAALKTEHIVMRIF